MTKLQWKALDWPGLETCEVVHDGRGWVAKGDIHAEYELGTPIHLTYTLHVNDDWTPRSISLKLQDGSSLHLKRDEFNHWQDEGGPRPGFNGCTFVDVSLSPITNSLPINALPFKKGDRQTIEVVYINGFTLDAHRTQQYYTKTGDNTYLYEDVESPEFKAEITVDRAGLVTSYPGLFTRQKT